MTTKVISTKRLRSVNGWEIEKSVEQNFNAFDEKKGRPVTFYACVQEDTIFETFDTLAEAVAYCKANMPG